MHVRVAVLVLLAACGRIGFDDAVRASDGSIDTDDGPAACGAPVFADDFEDGSFAPQWTVRNEPQVLVIESNGVATMSLGANAGDAYGDLVSACRYDMRDREFSIEILDIPNGANAELFLEIAIDADNRLGFDVFQNDRLQPYQRIGGVFMAVGEVTFDPIAHRFWRLIETAGTMRWETSSNRSTWTMRGMAATPFDLSSVTVGIHAGTFANVAAPGAAVVDNVDVR